VGFPRAMVMCLGHVSQPFSFPTFTTFCHDPTLSLPLLLLLFSLFSSFARFLSLLSFFSSVLSLPWMNIIVRWYLIGDIVQQNVLEKLDFGYSVAKITLFLATWYPKKKDGDWGAVWVCWMLDLDITSDSHRILSTHTVHAVFHDTNYSQNSPETGYDHETTAKVRKTNVQKKVSTLGHAHSTQGTFEPLQQPCTHHTLESPIEMLSNQREQKTKASCGYYLARRLGAVAFCQYDTHRISHGPHHK